MLITFPVGLTPVEQLMPARANGVRITMQRLTWPAGPLFRWDIYERDRNTGTLNHLAGADEQGGPATRKDGLPGDAPLVITASWTADKDKDLIRLEVNAVQSFQSDVTVALL